MGCHRSTLPQMQQDGKPDVTASVPGSGCTTLGRLRGHRGLAAGMSPAPSGPVRGTEGVGAPHWPSGCGAVVTAEGVGDALVHVVGLAVDAVGVDLEQDGDAVPGAAGGFGGGDPGGGPPGGGGGAGGGGGGWRGGAGGGGRGGGGGVGGGGRRGGGGKRPPVGAGAVFLEVGAEQRD